MQIMYLVEYSYSEHKEFSKLSNKKSKQPNLKNGQNFGADTSPKTKLITQHYCSAELFTPTRAQGTHATARSQTEDPAASSAGPEGRDGVHGTLEVTVVPATDHNPATTRDE